jgi:excisionase family DNA binding protein
MTPAEVGRAWGVNAKTVLRWVQRGRLPRDTYFKTPGGHLRFHRAAIIALRDGQGSTR